jgi:hypothetical protein
LIMMYVFIYFISKLVNEVDVRVCLCA